MSFFEAIDAEADQVGARVRKACLEMPNPDPATMFDSVYAAPNQMLAAEREQFAAYLDSFAEAESDAAEAGAQR
jgi:pyruvate dehydrogenase E1 component alpha subunit